MTTAPTLLSHVAFLLGERFEDIVVESLGYILKNSEAARRAVLQVVRDGGAKVSPINEVLIQAGCKGHSRPDLTLLDSQGVPHLLVEAKFGAALTDRQPVAYLNNLPTDQPSALLVVAPNRRLGELWDKMEGRVIRAKSLKAGESRKTRVGRRLPVSDERNLLLVSWTVLLNRILKMTREANDELGILDTFQLLGLVEMEDWFPYRLDEDGLSAEEQERIMWRERRDD